MNGSKAVRAGLLMSSRALRKPIRSFTSAADMGTQRETQRMTTGALATDTRTHRAQQLRRTKIDNFALELETPKCTAYEHS